MTERPLDADATVRNPAASVPPEADPAVLADLRALLGSTLGLRLIDGGPADPQAERLGRYRVAEHLGAGGMGEVLEVHDADLGRPVAAKIIRGRSDRRALRTFVLEARLTGQLEHPGVVPVHELGVTETGVAYFTMKRVAGRDLARVLGEPDAPGRSELLRIFGKVCETVAFAHSRGVIHRDLKPANIMVGEFGEVLVMDWGLAKIVGAPEVAERPPEVASRDAPPAAPNTADGTVMGTPAYMAPEQAAGEVRRLDARADVYALGAILYELLSGCAPHGDGPMVDVLMRVMAGQLVPPTQAAPQRAIPWELEAIVQRAMALRPEDRYGGATELHADIDAFLDGRLVSAASYGPIHATRKWLGRHPGVVRGAAAIGLTALVVVGAFARRQANRVAAARERVAALEPAETQARVDALLAPVAVDPMARTPPTPDQRAAHDPHLERLQALALAYAGWQRLEPDAGPPRAGLLTTYRALGRLAEVSEDFALSRFAFQQALLQRPGDARLTTLLAGVDRAQAARAGRHRRDIEGVLAAAGRAGQRSGDLSGLALILRYADEPQTAALLRDRLRKLTARLQTSARATILASNVLTSVERAAGWTALPGLPGAVDRWLGPATPDPAALQRLGVALDRLTQRARAGTPPGATIPSWQALLAAAQTRALDADGVRRSAIVVLSCRALGLLPRSLESVAALRRYLAVDFDETRAVAAGVALARWSADDPGLLAALQHRVGLHAEPREPARWDPAGPWWRQVSRELRPGVATPATPTLADGLQALIQQGHARAASGDPQGALDAYQRAIERAPRQPAGWSGRGKMRRALGDLDGALEDLARAAELAADVASLDDLGVTRLAAGDAAGAIRELGRAIALDPRIASPWNNRGNAKVHLGDLAGAVADYTRAIELAPREARHHANRGHIRSRLGDLKGALADLDRALELDPRDRAAWSNRGLAKLALGELDGALADCSRAVELSGDEALAWSARGRVRLARGDVGGARADLDRAVELDPRCMPARVGRARVRLRQRDAAGAEADATRALALDARATSAWAARAAARMARGNTRGALADLGQALAVEPDNATLWRNRARLREAAGDPAGAARDLDRSIQLAPGSAQGHYERGRIHQAQRQPARAIASYSRALALRPTLVAAWNNRANVRREQGDAAGALADLDRALALDPRYWRAWANRAVTLIALDRTHEAAESFRRAIEVAPESVRPALRGELQKLGR